MKRLFVLTVAAVAAATLTAAAPAHLPGAAYCSARQPAKVELRCAARDHWHALTTIRWLRNHPYAGTVLVVKKRGGERAFASVVRTRVATSERRTVTRNHRWLLRESAERIAEARARLNPWPVPGWFVGSALCVHGGEGSWSADTGNGFGGGLQFTVGTWNEAAGHDRLRHLPYVSSTGQIAAQPPAAQIYAAFIIVTRRGGRWGDWPNTARACGLPT